MSNDMFEIIERSLPTNIHDGFGPQVSRIRTGESTWFARTVKLQFRDVAPKIKNGSDEVSIEFNRSSLIDFLNARGYELDKGYFGFLFGSDDDEIQKAFDEVFKGKEVQIFSDTQSHSSLITKVEEQRMNNFVVTAFGKAKVEKVEDAQERLQELKKITGAAYEIFESNCDSDSYQIKFIVPASNAEKLEKSLKERSGGNITVQDQKISVDDKIHKQVILSIAESGILFGHYLQKLGDPADRESLKNLLKDIMLKDEEEKLETEKKKSEAKNRLLAGGSLRKEREKLEAERLQEEMKANSVIIREGLDIENSKKFAETNTVSAAEERLGELIKVTGGRYEILKSSTEDPRIKFTVPSRTAQMLIESLKYKSDDAIKLEVDDQIEKVGDNTQITLSFDESRILLGCSPENIQRTKVLLRGIRPKF